MRHSIIIPCRNRWAYVDVCLWSIQRSADTCGVSDYEVVVVNSGPAVDKILPYRNLVVIDYDGPMPILNKPKLQNIGIEAATGDVITFIDADVVVSSRWMAYAKHAHDTAITKLCYRVVGSPIDDSVRRRFVANADRLLAAHTWCVRESALCDIERDAPLLKRKHEAYGLPERKHDQRGVLFGNSHFSIDRNVLGSLRFNEEYVGRGYEDIWMNRELWMRDPERYCPALVDSPDAVIVSLPNPDGNGGPDWYDTDTMNTNARRYHNSWKHGAKDQLLHRMKDSSGQLPSDILLEMLENGHY